MPLHTPHATMTSDIQPVDRQESGSDMRGSEQHVERKIRLWVVQQERIRLMNGQPGGIRARAEEPAEPPSSADAPAPEG
jgi:hypothetical protein